MVSETPLILQIQSDCLDTKVSVADILRKAKVAADKLELYDLREWIDRELNGYGENDELPDYRILTGEPKAFNPYRGWQPILSRDPKMAQNLARAPIGQAIGPMEEGLKSRSEGSILFFPYHPALKAKIIADLQFPTDIHVRLSEASIVGIVDTVRNMLLDWTLELEKKGILGEGMSFKSEDKPAASTVTNNITAQYIGVAGSTHDQAAVTSNQVNFNAPLDIDAVINLLQQAGPSLQDLPDDIQDEARQRHSDLSDEIKKDPPDQSRLRELLRSFGTVCEGAAGNLTAQGIVSIIKDLLG